MLDDISEREFEAGVRRLVEREFAAVQALPGDIVEAPITGDPFHPHDADELAAHKAMRLLARRIDQLAEELDLDRTRVRDWALVQAVMSAWWIIEDGGSLLAEDLTCAQCLAAIKR